jgi:hypothetical protein
MASPEQFFAIILDGATPAQRNAVQHRVKRATGTWWHTYGDVWIVRGPISPGEWIQRLQPVFKSGTASFLVLQLPGTDQARAWGYFGPDPTHRVAWLHRNYTKDSG